MSVCREDWEELQELREYLEGLKKLHGHSSFISKDCSSKVLQDEDLISQVNNHVGTVRKKISSHRTLMRSVPNNSIGERRKRGVYHFQKFVSDIRPSIRYPKIDFTNGAQIPHLEFSFKSKNLTAYIDRDYAFSSSKLYFNMRKFKPPGFMILWSRRITKAKFNHEFHESQIFWWVSGEVVQERQIIGLNTHSNAWVIAETLLQAKAKLARLIGREVTKVLTPTTPKESS